MADIALVQDDYGGWDVALDGYDLLRDGGLETAVVISLFTDRRATSDQLPAGLPAADLRGYWGDVRTAASGDQTGSHLWLLSREKETAETLSRARKYAREALQWMIDDKVSTRIDVRASYPRRGFILLEIDIYRPGGKVARYRYHYEWAAQAAKRAA